VIFGGIDKMVEKRIIIIKGEITSSRFFPCSIPLGLHSVPHDGVLVLTEMASLDAGPFSLNSIEQSNSGLRVVVDLQTLICEPIGQ